MVGRDCWQTRRQAGMISYVMSEIVRTIQGIIVRSVTSFCGLLMPLISCATPPSSFGKGYNRKAPPIFCSLIYLCAPSRYACIYIFAVVKGELCDTSRSPLHGSIPPSVCRSLPTSVSIYVYTQAPPASLFHLYPRLTCILGNMRPSTLAFITRGH